MPLYDFECDNCKRIAEQLFKMDGCPMFITCPFCRPGIAKKIIVLGHGGSFDDHPRWLDDGVRESLQDSDRITQKLEKPIETRGEYKQFMKEHGFVVRE